jgi:hypothetical protein
MNLEQVEVLLNSSKGAALYDLIKQSLISPTIFHYESILKHPSIVALEKQTDVQRYFNILKLFSYGTFNDYSQNKEFINYELNQRNRVCYNKYHIVYSLCNKYLTSYKVKFES